MMSNAPFHPQDTIGHSNNTIGPMNSSMQNVYIRKNTSDSVEIACEYVNTMLARDTRLPSPHHLLPPSSRDYSFPPSSDISIRRHSVIPETVLQEWDRVGENCKVTMGLLTELDRVWVGVNGKLFIWEAASGGDLTVFEVNIECMHVLVVRVRPGVFVESIQHALVIVTPLTVQLLAVTVMDGSLRLHVTDMIASTDEVIMTSVHSFPDGRMLFGGMDGCLYELDYGVNQSTSLFTSSSRPRKCRLVNKSESIFMSSLLPIFKRRTTHAIMQIVSDNEHIITLNDNNQIDVYKKDNVQKRYSLTNIFHQAERICPVFSQSSFKIVSIHPITMDPYISLIACLSNGTRLYFTSVSREHRHYDPIQLQQTEGTHNQWECVHVRMMPMVSNEDPKKLVHRSVTPSIQSPLASLSMFMAAVNEGNNDDLLVFASIDPASILQHPSRSVAFERASFVPVEGKVWQIASPSSQQSLLINPVNLEVYWVLTNAAVYEVIRSRPIDWLVRGEMMVKEWGIEQATALSCFLLQCPELHCPALQFISPMLAPFQFDTLHPVIQGLYIYFSRLMHEQWRRYVHVDLELTPKLSAFHQFLLANESLLKRLGLTGDRLFVQTEAYQSLTLLASRSIELIMFLSLCHDYAVIDEKVEFFRLIYVDGKPTIRIMADSLIRKQLQQPMCSVEGVCQVLRARCPQLFSSDDVLLYVGMEDLERASRYQGASVPVKKQLIDAAVNNLCLAAPAMTFSSLTNHVQQLRSMRAYPGIVQLIASYAQAMDPDNHALIAYKHPNDLNMDRVEVEQAYGLLLDCLNDLLSMDISDLAAVLMCISQTKDELLQIRVFEHLINSDHSTVLLESMIASPYIEPFLICQLNAQTSSKYILWRLYGMQERYQEAGDVLTRLAESPDIHGVGVEERVEYLSRAISMYKMCSQATHDHIQHVQDLLDVATCQLEAYQLVPECSDVKKELDNHLWSLSDLFNRVARPLKMHSLSLKLLSLTSNSSDALSMAVWQQVIDDALKGADPFTDLLNALTPLVRQFGSSLPLLPLADSLLQLAYCNQLPCSWMLDLPIPPLLFLSAFESMLACSSFWRGSEQRLYLVDCLCQFSQQHLQMKQLKKVLEGLKEYGQVKAILSLVK